MSEMDQDPTRDPQLADTYSALVQLLAAAEMPTDSAALASRIAVRLERHARRRRLRIGAGLLAAASLVVAVGLIARQRPAEQAVAVAAPEQVAVEDSPFEIASWDDDLADQTAALATAVRTTEQHWHEQPDSIALLKSQVDQFEQEVGDGAL